MNSYHELADDVIVLFCRPGFLKEMILDWPIAEKRYSAFNLVYYAIGYASELAREALMY